MKKLLISSLLGLLFINPVLAEDKRGEIDRSINLVQIDKGKDNVRNWQKAEKGNVVSLGDTVRTGLRSVAQISYDDGTITRIGSRSTVTVNDRKLTLKRGYMWGKVNKETTKGLKIFTSSAVASILGTEFFVENVGNSTILVVLEGEIEFKGKKGTVKVTEGTFATIDFNGNVSDPMVFDKNIVLSKYSELLID